ncbi:MAG: sigma-70 family RNA polymerase sigma factor [Planctomycetota bacterium]
MPAPSVLKKKTKKTSRLPLEERVRQLGQATFEQLDTLLDSATTHEAFDRVAARLVESLKKVKLLPSDSPRLTRGGEGVRDFLLRSRKSDRALSTYLSEIGKIPRTRREDEVRLGRRLDFLRRRVQAAALAAGLSKEVAEEILEFHSVAYRTGPVHQACVEYRAVRAEFIERNLHLVVSAATAYRTYSTPLLDLIQEGNAGLIRAVEKFDWRMNVRLRTYAALWIRQAIERSIASSKGIVRLPNYVQQKMRRLRREGQIPANDRDTSVKDLKEAFNVSHKVAGRLLETHRATSSLDQTFEEDGESHLSRLQARDDHDCDFMEWELPLLKSRISEALSSLSDQERQVLACRYGFGDDESMTLEEIGREMKVSRERIRQVQLRAIRKLRSSSIKEKLAQFV